MRQSVIFSPEGNLYAKTNLLGLAFSYATASVPSAAACRALIARNPSVGSSPTRMSVAGVPFTAAVGSDAGLSHEQVFTIDSTWFRGKCFLFERDEMTVAPGVQEGVHTLTAQQNRALQRHLREVFESVRFNRTQ